MGKLCHIVTFCGSFASMAYLWRQKQSMNSYFHNQIKLRKTKLFAEEKQKLEKKTRVLIVGAGLTGCLTAYLLKEKCGNLIDLHILERSPYPSGRFGAGVRYKNEISGWDSQSCSSPTLQTFATFVKASSVSYFLCNLIAFWHNLG